MIRYQCSRCKAIFDKSQIVVDTWREYQGECFGFPAWETVSEGHCPECGNTYIDEYWEDYDDDFESEY